jgi:3-hydroxypropanoate dehydrogenase
MTQTLHALPDAALDQLFRQARTVSAFRPEPVPEAIAARAGGAAWRGPHGLQCPARPPSSCAAPRPGIA